jgi:sulfonate transport system permease protein
MASPQIAPAAPPVAESAQPDCADATAASPLPPAKTPWWRHRRLVSAVVPLLLLAAWWLATDGTRFFSENQLPPPRQVWTVVRDLAASGDLTRHLVASVRRVGLGFAVGAVAALVLGTGVGLSRTFEWLADPTLQALRNVPSLAWVPFLLLWLGIDETPKITLIAIGSFFPVYLNLVSGIRQADRKLVEVGAIFGLSRGAQIGQIFLPAASPYILAGLRIGAGQAWLFLVAAELIASTRGLGFMLIDGQNNLRPDIMVVGILTLALLGKTTDSLLRLVEKRWLVWADTFEGKK